MGFFGDLFKKEAGKMVSDFVGDITNVNKTEKFNPAKQLRQDVIDRTKKVLEENFSEYIVYNNIEPGQFGNFYGGRNYDFVLYDGSAKKLAILVLSGHNDYGCKAVRISKEAATEEGIKCINIMSYLPSTYDYIKARIQENL